VALGVQWVLAVFDEVEAQLLDRFASVGLKGVELVKNGNLRDLRKRRGIRLT